MHPFRRYIRTYSDLSDKDWTLVCSALSRKEYSVGELILKGGQICRKLYFLEDGFLRYWINRDGVEVTKYFTEPPYCFTSQRSLTKEIPSNDNIEVLEEAIVWEMDKQDAFGLLRLPSWSEFVRKLIQEVQYSTEEILEAIQNQTAEARYIEMIETNDIILQKAPQKYIASYLGIAPQSLSRIRKKFLVDQRKLT
ncbi:MAG: Crp/Fnr family transcriptional regulator [Bacteroidota bacterium]